MAARLTDRQKKKIVADYTLNQNYSAVAKLNGVTRNTVKAIVRQDPDIAEKCRRKKEQNTADILAYMESKRGIVCEILEKGLNVLNDEEKLEEASPSQITTALGTLIDKWAMVAGGPGDNMQEDNLSRSLRELGEGLESDE